MNIQPLFAEILSKHGARPTKAQIRATIAEFGLFSNVDIANLLFSVFVYFRTRAVEGQFRCTRRRPLRGKVCGESIIKIDPLPEMRVLKLYCKLGHVTEIPIR